MFAANGGAASGDKTYIEDVFSTYPYTGSGGDNYIATNITMADVDESVYFTKYGGVNATSLPIGPVFFHKATNKYVFLGFGTGSSQDTAYPQVSSDFITWTGSGATAVRYNIRSVAESSTGLLVGVGSYTESGPTAYASYSTNALSWTNTGVSITGSSTGQFASVCVDSNDNFVAVGFNSGNQAVYGKTSNGATWTTGLMTGTGTTGKMRSVAVNPSNFFVAVGEGGRVSTSNDGTTWSALTTVNSNYLLSEIIYSVDRFIAVGSNTSTNDKFIITTQDGVNWSAPVSFGTAFYPSKLTRKTSGMLIVTSGATYRTSNDNGATWSPETLMPGTGTGWSIGGVGVDANDNFFVVGNMNVDYIPCWSRLSVTVAQNNDELPYGGMVWIKNRTGTATDHAIYDTVRGATQDLASNSTSGSTTQSTGITAFPASGFRIGSLAKINTSSVKYASWSFRKAPKFFDVVTYTGNGANRTIAHSLGQAPGMVIVKCTSTSGDWVVYHRGGGSAGWYYPLNLTSNATTSSTVWNSTAPTASVFSVGTSALTNSNGATYVAYLFAHDTTTDGLIQCGSFNTDASGKASINLGWEPQYLLVKNTSLTDDWYVVDNLRGFSTTGDRDLNPNTSNAETSITGVVPTATGFDLTANALGASGFCIYMAIRRGPMRTPTSGSQVFDVAVRAGNNGNDVLISKPFAPDAAMIRMYGSGAIAPVLVDRLRDNKYLSTSSTAVEATVATVFPALMWDNALGIDIGNDGTVNASGGYQYTDWVFKRAPGFFDVVCYTNLSTVTHNLGVKPELIIYKSRNNAIDWTVDLTNHFGYLNKADALTSASVLASRATSTTWQPYAFTSGANMVGYLFASCPGVSSIGSYTGNGTSQTINCGFAAGARFVLIKRADNTGDWYIWDTARGIVSGNDPHISLNTSAADVTTDNTIDPATSGFIVNQVSATNVNVNAATYIYLAIA